MDYPSFDVLPDYEDFDSLSNFYDIEGEALQPLKNWCYFSEIIAPNYHVMRPSAVVQDLDGKNHPIVFYLDNNNDSQTDKFRFRVGHTLALLYADRKTFLDGTVGIRREDTDFKVFQCPLIVLIDESNKIGKECCFGCGKANSALLKCGKCKIAKYCGKECQSSHWKCHRSLCADMNVLKKLRQLVRSPFETFVSFEQLESDSWQASLNENEETKTETIRESHAAENAVMNTGSFPNPFILFFETEEDLFFGLFGEQSSWKCDFQSFSENSSKSQLITMLQNPRLLSVIIHKVGGRHWNEIIKYYKNGGYVVYADFYGYFDAPKKLSQAFDLDWTFSEYTRYEYELTLVGEQLLGNSIPMQEYSKSNLLKVPSEDRILVPKHYYATVEDLIQDMFDDEDVEHEELMRKARKEYASIRERLNNSVPLAFHKDKGGGSIAYIGFVNSAGNIPIFAQAICKRVTTASLLSDSTRS